MVPTVLSILFLVLFNKAPRLSYSFISRGNLPIGHLRPKICTLKILFWKSFKWGMRENSSKVPIFRTANGKRPVIKCLLEADCLVSTQE